MSAVACPLDRRTRVADIVAAHPECARVLSQHRIDFCCKGGIPLEEACAQHGVDPAAVLAELEAARRDGGSEVHDDVRELPTPMLIARILTTHHAYLRRTLPWISTMAEKVGRVHGTHDPRLVEVAGVVRELTPMFLRHLDEEEGELFPALTTARPREVGPRLAAMRTEHEAVGEALARLRALTQDYAAPGWACTTYRTLLAELSHLEEDTHRHVHLENHVLAERFSCAARPPAEPAVSLSAGLSADHAVILGLLDVLERLAEEARRGALRVELAGRVVDLVRRFADEAHHGKEERHLFPALEEAGLSTRGGPLVVMLTEHDLGRENLTLMRDALSQCASDPDAPLRFARACNTYCFLMRQHIAKEDMVLFPMADAIVPQASWPRLLEAFEAAERAALGAGDGVRGEIAELVLAFGRPAPG